MDRTSATHEAGHAVGRLLTAELMGFSQAEAVDHIAQDAICYGPLVCKSLSESFGPRFKASSSQTVEAMWDLLSTSGSEHERSVSMLCRMLFITMGPCAEAKLARLQDPRPIWNSPAAAQDRADFYNSARLLRIAAPQIGSGDAQSAFLDHAVAVVRQPAVWSAINAIAFEMRSSKSDMSGECVAKLALPHLEDTTVDVLPRGWTYDDAKGS